MEGVYIELEEGLAKDKQLNTCISQIKVEERTSCQVAAQRVAWRTPHKNFDKFDVKKV